MVNFIWCCKKRDLMFMRIDKIKYKLRFPVVFIFIGYLISLGSGAAISSGVVSLAYTTLLRPFPEGYNNGPIADDQKYGWEEGQQGEGEPVLNFIKTAAKRKTA